MNLLPPAGLQTKAERNQMFKLFFTSESMPHTDSGHHASIRLTREGWKHSRRSRCALLFAAENAFHFRPACHSYKRADG